MTFFAGVVLHDQVAVVVDRRLVKLYPILWWCFEELRDYDRPKWENMPLPWSTFFLSSGHNVPAKEFFDAAIRDLATRKFTISDLQNQKGYLTEIARSIWSEYQPKLLEINKRRKHPWPCVNLEMLFGGLDSTGNPFLMIVESYNRFEGTILTSPGRFYVLQQEPEVEKRVKEIMRAFLGRIKGTQGSGIMARFSPSLSEEGERDLAKEMLPQIISFVSGHDKYVSPCGDQLIIHRGGREVFSF